MAVLNDHKNFITVAVPYTSRKVQVKFKAMTVTDDEGVVFKNLPVNLSVGATSVMAYSSFSVPKLLKSFNRDEPRFVKIELKTTGFEGVVMEVDGIDEQALEALENTKLEHFIMEKVLQRVNSVLEEMAKPISREIRMRKRRSQFKEMRRKMKHKKEEYEEEKIGKEEEKYVASLLDFWLS
uniref:Putative kinetochore protein spc24 n=1 Tax=Lygus hesperus TaxID=30085 RepID=A0A0A9WB09_LYGHE